ncbi:hypothetical protein [Kordia jejudonensis]|uniref:hypothetical protein n=1 Tax=Kordia jejudonensis TaxID=1348245 RepID=UPI0006297171|nr:hypothetical protein [Kordia jejudonensis]
MKEKRYYSQFSYFIKILFIVILLGLAFYFITEASDLIAEKLSRALRKNMVATEYVLNAFVGIILLLAILLVIVRGKPQVTINATTLRTNRFKRDFSEIKSYHKGKGGSEPYIISNDGKQLDIELSWFSKKDRTEIESLIIQQIETANL